MIGGLKDSNLHKRFIATNEHPITMIDFVERSVKRLNSLSRTELRDFDFEWILDFIKSIKPIYNEFGDYVDIIDSDESGFIVFNIDNINTESPFNTLDLYSCVDGKLKYSGSFFAGNNINIHKILNYKMIYAKGDQLMNRSWYKKHMDNEFETSLFKLLNHIFGFIYFDSESKALVDNVDVLDGGGNAQFNLMAV